MCDCPKDKKVNADWVGFLKDQRQGRILFIGQFDKAATKDVEVEEEKKHV